MPFDSSSTKAVSGSEPRMGFQDDLSVGLKRGDEVHLGARLIEISERRFHSIFENSSCRSSTVGSASWNSYPVFTYSLVATTLISGI